MDLGLNAPYGARCFLTIQAPTGDTPPILSLNAPYGARCFLTVLAVGPRRAWAIWVLMHLMALGAF